MRGTQFKSLTKILLILFAVAAAGLQTMAQTTIPFPAVGSTWRHCSNNLDGVDWTNPSYNDTAPPWFEGPGLLSNDSGNGAIAPMIQTPMVGPRVSVDGGPVQHSYYFRKKFSVAGPVVPSLLRFSGRIDDGIVLFLNGNPIYYLRITNDTPLVYASSDFATGYACGGDPDCGDDVFEAPAIGLVAGENTLAAILMQEGTDSSDMTFGLGITEMVPAVAPSIVNTNEPRDRLVPQNQTVMLIGNATGIPAPTYQWYKDGNEIPGATGPTYTIQTMQQGDAGMYYCRATNLAGFADTRTANIQYTEDHTAPMVVRAVGDASFMMITVEFDEFVDPTTAQDGFNYAVSGGLALAGNPVLAPGGKAVLMTLGSAAAPDTVYTVTVNNVADLAMNAITTTNIMFRSWAPTRCGGLIHEIYDTGGGNSVNLLTSHPNFPNNPREVINLTSFDTEPGWAGLSNTDPRREAMGGRVRGLFIPPVSGDWIFYLGSDDAGELRFNPNGPSASGAVTMAMELDCCDEFENATPPQSLVAGQAYYIEALYKEGTGGDWVRVGARIAGDMTALAPIPGSQLGAGAAPANIVGPVLITQQPADLSATENATATFTVAATNINNAPICYQWQRDGVDVPGAIGASYSFAATMADNGAKFKAVASVLGAETTSSEVTLTVSADTVGPQVIAAYSSLDGTNITIRFNEKLASGTAVDTFNYSLPTFTINSAVLLPNQTDVLLTFSPALAVGSSHQLTVQNLEDLAMNPMVTTQLTVKAYVITYGCARYDLFLGLSSATVALSDLLMAPAYPHSPSITRFKTNMELNTADEFEGYGTRLTGFLIPPVSGDYVFYFHSDDNGQFSLSTDATPANLTLLCNEPVWSGRRTWVGEAGGGGRVGVPSASGGPQANISGPRNLTAGQMYYFEALMKEGGGGDNMGVNWKPPGGTEPVNDTPSAIPSEALASLADPVREAANIKGPKINFSISGNQITFSWQLPGYKLQSKTDLGTPGGWVDVPNGATSPVTVSIGAGNQFFQLVQ